MGTMHSFAGCDEGLHSLGAQQKGAREFRAWVAKICPTFQGNEPRLLRSALHSRGTGRDGEHLQGSGSEVRVAVA